jgi:hypothetical protein
LYGIRRKLKKRARKCTSATGQLVSLVFDARIPAIENENSIQEAGKQFYKTII